MKKIQKIIDTLHSLEKIIKNEYKAEIVGIFGSYARKEKQKKPELKLSTQKILDDLQGNS